LAYSHDFAGIVGGYERDLGNQRLGFVGGFSSGRIETDVASLKTDVDSFFGGAYLHYPTGGANFTFSMLAGFENYDNERLVFDNLNGAQTAKGEFDNHFVSASLSAQARTRMIGRFELRPSATATYTASFFDGYTEEGAGGSNLTVEDRAAQTLNTRAQLALGYNTGGMDMEFRAGFDGQFSSEDEIRTTVKGANLVFDASDRNDFVAGFIGARAKLAGSENLSLIGDVEYQFGQDDAQDFTASLNVSFSF
jgi:outer membrane autotransporter protein